MLDVTFCGLNYYLSYQPSRIGFQGLGVGFIGVELFTQVDNRAKLEKRWGVSGQGTVQGNQ